MAGRSVWQWFFRHPRLALAVVAALLITAVGMALVPLTLRNLQRVEAIDARLRETRDFQQLRVRLQRSLFEDLGPVLSTNHFLAEDLRIQVGLALSLGERLAPGARSRLEGIQRALTSGPYVSRITLLEAVDLLGLIIDAETAAQTRLLEQTREATRRELGLTLAALVALAGLALLGTWLVPRGLLNPLRALVRSASQTLLEQHRTLANAERLAVAGETAAGVAHELRNPLAGVILGLGNLKAEANDPGLIERLSPLVEELERVNRTLRDYLSVARPEPEPAVDVDVGLLVENLLDLLEFQVSDTVRLRSQVEEKIRCSLPPDRFRQVLLNLILNSAQAVGRGPGSITVTGRIVDDSLIIEVRDTGPGFPAEILDAKIRPFSTGREGGTGLGLVLVQRAMRDVGGSFRLENPPDGGARVSLSIPCARGEVP